MPDPGLMNAKMRAYMEALSPPARMMLMRAVRVAQERGEVAAPLQSMMKAATFETGTPTSATEAAPAPVPELPWPERLRAAFFSPLEPFVVDLVYPNKLVGRIQRRSLDGIWTLVVRDLSPGLAEAAPVAGPHETVPDAVTAARKLRRTLTPKFDALLTAGDLSSKPLRRLAAQVGSEMALLDLFDVTYIFQREAAFLNLTGQLPRAISPLDLSDAGPVTEIVRTAVETHLIDPAFAAIPVIRRSPVAAPVALMALTLANVTDPKLAAASPYARIIDAVLSEVQMWVNRFASDLQDRAERMQALADLRDYHELVRQIEIGIEPSQVATWHRRLGAACKEMSDLIARELEPLSGLIRRALRVDSQSGRFVGSFDELTADDAEFGARLFMETRGALDALALNELVTKQRRPIEQTVEVLTTRLLGELKAPGGAEQPDLVKAVDAAIRLSGTVFGEDYAVHLRRSRDLTVVKPASKAAGG